MKFSHNPNPSPAQIGGTQWADAFHTYSRDCDTDAAGRLIFLSWCTEQFGEGGHTFYPDYCQGRWSCVAGSLNCYVMFKDSNDAMLFKLTWDNAPT